MMPLDHWSLDPLSNPDRRKSKRKKREKIRPRDTKSLISRAGTLICMSFVVGMGEAMAMRAIDIYGNTTIAIMQRPWSWFGLAGAAIMMAGVGTSKGRGALSLSLRWLLEKLEHEQQLPYSSGENRKLLPSTQSMTVKRMRGFGRPSPR